MPSALRRRGRCLGAYKERSELAFGRHRSALGEPDAAEQVLEAGVGAEGVREGVHLQGDHRGVARPVVNYLSAQSFQIAHHHSRCSGGLLGTVTAGYSCGVASRAKPRARNCRQWQVQRAEAKAC